MRLEEKKFRKTTPSLSDPYAIYCCQPRARIRHENAHDKTKQNDKNATTITDNNNERAQPIASASIATAKLSTVPSATKTIATSPSFTMTAGWSADKLKKAKMKRRAKLMKAKLDAS
jgi:3-polyprenyl-4-hydroxybenzoate decarboxylase